MTEAVKVATRKSPLDEVHKSLGAVMTDCGDWSLPASYGDELFEYAHVRERGAGLIDLSSRGRVRVTGSEAVPFLNGLITNDMKTLLANRWMPAVFPNVQGRILASVRIIRLADDKAGKVAVPVFVLDTEAATHDRVVQTIERFTFAGDFHVTDLTSQTALISLQGKTSREKIQAVLGATAAATSIGGVTQSIWKGETVASMRASHTAADGFDLIVNASHAAGLWHAFVGAGVRPVGHEALEILRIEAGIPRYGADMDDTTVVTETSLDDAVSYTKGCYIGQEIIARIKYRGHVAKKLRGLICGLPGTIDGQAALKSIDGKEVGRTTSTTLSPHLGCRIALGYIKYEHMASGTEVRVNELPARIVDLPFVTPDAQE